MKYYLDKEGVAYLWSKIKAVDDTKLENVKVNDVALTVTDHTVNITTDDIVKIKTINGETITGEGDFDLNTVLKTLDGNPIVGTGDIKFKTINDESIIGDGNIKIDTTIYKVVSSLPTSDVDESKIYLVKKTTIGESDNLYDQYIYVNGAWESFGDFDASADLKDYAKLDEANTFTQTQTVKSLVVTGKTADDVLLGDGTTASLDELGKVKDVQWNGESILDASTGIANLELTRITEAEIDAICM